MKQNANLASPPQSADTILCAVPAAWCWRVRGKGTENTQMFWSGKSKNPMKLKVSKLTGAWLFETNV